MRIAFIGLGVMGFPMAGHLANTGYEIVVYNRTIAKAEEWAKKYNKDTKINVAATPAIAAQDSDIVFCCVGNDSDVKQVILGDVGVYKTLSPNSILVDHTTTSAILAKELAKLCPGSFIDAPVSGGQAGAENGTLSIMCGASKDDYIKILPVISNYGKTICHMGEVGTGQLSKMVNQICIAGLLQGLAEGLKFGEKANLDMNKVISVISEGAAGSWQMSNRGKTMLSDEFDFGFAVDWMRKDLNICIEEGDKIGASLEITKIIEKYYSEIQDMGGSRWDSSSLIKRLK